MSLKTGVVGLGVMGGAFAGHMLDSGFEVQGFDPSEDVFEKFKDKNLTRANSPAEAASNVDLVMLSLPNYKIVEQAVSGENGVFSSIETRGIDTKNGILKYNLLMPKFLEINLYKCL